MTAITQGTYEYEGKTYPKSPVIAAEGGAYSDVHHLTGTLGWSETVTAELLHGVFTVTLWAGSHGGWMPTVRYSPMSDRWEVLDGGPSSGDFTPTEAIRQYVTDLYRAALTAHRAIYDLRFCERGKVKEAA